MLAAKLAMSEPAAVSTYSKDNPFPARLTENRLLTKPGSGKETRHFVIDLTGSRLHYKTGDSLGVYPSNRSSEVNEILQRMGANGDEPVVLPKLPAAIPFGEALASKLALSGPTRKIVELLASRASHSTEKARLSGLLAPESKELAASFLGEREFVDLLAEFPSARLSPQELTDSMRRLMPRLYSIASSPHVHPEEAHLTVAVVHYRSNGRERVGVASTFLAERVNVGAPVPVFISHSHFGPPEDGAQDAIMVGPGTGIAPFRAFLQERAALGATGRNWIFFGEQKRATDFLYEEDWKRFQEIGRLTRLDTAFSRDQANKIYVQDRMRENAAELWAWLDRGASFFVCGDAKRMAKDVDTALHDIIAEQGGMPPDQAAAYVKQMKKDRRYQRDVY